MGLPTKLTRESRRAAPCQPTLPAHGAGARVFMSWRLEEVVCKRRRVVYGTCSWSPSAFLIEEFALSMAYRFEREVTLDDSSTSQ
jgi:hypothetical protein